MSKQIDPIGHSTPEHQNPQAEADDAIPGQHSREPDTSSPANGVVPGRPIESAAAPISKRLRSRLLALVNQDLVGSDLPFALDAVAEEFKRPINLIEKLYKALLMEKHGEGNDGSLLEDLERLSPTDRVDVMDLIPPQLAAGFRAIRVTTEYEPLVMLAVLLAGLSAALPLDSQIELDQQNRFRQPLTLWVCVLMESGALKSPMLSRLISQPWEKAVDPLMKEAHRQELNAWRQRKEEARLDSREFNEKAPSELVTRISGALTEGGMDECFAIHDRWGNRSMLQEVDEGAGLLNQLMNPSAGDKFHNWYLPRYDGKESCNAYVDSGKRRPYKSCRLGLIIFCQPARYLEIAGNGDQSGFTARLMVVEQHEVRQNFLTNYTEEQIQASDDLDALLIRLYSSLAGCQRLHLELSQEAFARFQEVNQELYERKCSSLSEAERSLLNKSSGRIGRLAAGFHLLWLSHGGSGQVVDLEPQGVVGLEAMERAITFHKLLLDRTVGVRLSASEHGTLSTLGLKLHRKTWGLPDHEALFGKLRNSFASKDRPSGSEMILALRPLVEKGYGSLNQITYRGQKSWSYKAKRALPPDS